MVLWLWPMSSKGDRCRADGGRCLDDEANPGGATPHVRCPGCFMPYAIGLRGLDLLPAVRDVAKVFASQSALVAAALEQMIRDEEEREVALGALAEEIRNRLQTPSDAFLDAETTFARARARVVQGGQ